MGDMSTKETGFIRVNYNRNKKGLLTVERLKTLTSSLIEETSMKPYLLLILVFTIAACSATPTPQETGLLEGHLTIGPLTPVVIIGQAEPTPAPEVYAAYPIVVYEPDGKTEVARVTAGSEGNYRLVLPVGTYLVNTQPEGIAFSKDLPQEVTIQSGQVTRLDIDIDTGIR
jgi:hypothetical protein